jgi:hypothetical protein
MPRNTFFSHGTRSEQLFHEDLIIESLSIYGLEFYYIPRVLVAKDEILGEDRLSYFGKAFKIEMYLENTDGFDGQGAFIQKFGLMIEQSATLVVSRRRWDQMIGRHNATQLSNRPCEGDLIYFPLTKALFEIKFVQHQDPFYQLGKLYVYKLQVELFQYSSERLDTGVYDIDAIENIKTFSIDPVRNGSARVVSVNLVSGGTGYNIAPEVSFVSTTGSGAKAVAVLGNTPETATQVVRVDVTDGGFGYETAPDVAFIGSGYGAVANAIIEINIDENDSYGDNNKFISQSDNVFNESNPFGDML